MEGAFTDTSIRKLLTLENDSSLSKEELWLKDAYANIVSNLIRYTIIPPVSSKFDPFIPKFDPFISKFNGIDYMKYNPLHYQALLEVSSYFFASKGGRGVLIEKIIASKGSYSSYGIKFSDIISMIMAKNKSSIEVDQFKSQWKMKKDNIKNLKFDLVNIIDDAVIILELKNRIDSGGVDARHGSLDKKFFLLGRLIENEEKIFNYDGRDYSFPEMLSLFGIKKVDMYLGLLYNTEGQEATVNDDRYGHGFYSSSKTAMEGYVNEPHGSTDISFNRDNRLSISIVKEGFSASINMVYGSEVIRKFTGKQEPLTTIMDKVFSSPWDDIWLALHVAISQRALLLENKKNHISEIMTLKENSKEFQALFNSFCDNSLDREMVQKIVSFVQDRINFSNLPTAAIWEVRLADCIYALSSYFRSKSYILSRNKANKNRGNSRRHKLSIFVDSL